jgi:4-amino-4-deoxy-L-arabinose transferase-like glycosyltransferase
MKEESSESSVKIRGNPWRVFDFRSPHPAIVFAVIFVVIFLLHAPLLQLPYFWDEAGYYVAAARDLLLTGSLIPHTTVSNAHPPLVMAWVALWWKVFGFAPLVTRSAMLVVAAFSLLGFFRLAELAANMQVAIAATLCTALYPVFFAQSSLAQVDLAAAGFIFWGLSAYLDRRDPDHCNDEGRPLAVAAWFSLAALAKETAILAPLALAAWEVIRFFLPSKFMRLPRGTATDPHEDSYQGTPSDIPTTPATQRGRAALQGRVSGSNETGALAPELRRLLALLFPLFPLTLWYAYHYFRTGYIFGNPEFVRYNVSATLNPWRFLLALALRLWQVFGYLHLWLLTLLMFLAMLLPPIEDRAGMAQVKTGRVGTGDVARPSDPDSTTIPRPRIPIPAQIIFLIIISTYVFAMALIGGAVLARYMLPAVPLVILLAVSTLRRRLRYWPAAIALVAAAFVSAWFWNPPYGFSPEDNLAYRDFIVLHEDAERFLEARYPMAHVLTAWPASNELASPWLGYITRPMQVVRIEDFSLEQILSAADFRSHDPSEFNIALVFSTKYDPPPPWLLRNTLIRWKPSLWNRWQALKRRFFGYHQDLPPEAAARILGGRIVFHEERKGQWIAVIELEQNEIENAGNAQRSELDR